MTLLLSVCKVVFALGRSTSSNKSSGHVIVSVCARTPHKVRAGDCDHGIPHREAPSRQSPSGGAWCFPRTHGGANSGQAQVLPWTAGATCNSPLTATTGCGASMPSPAQSPQPATLKDGNSYFFAISFIISIISIIFFVHREDVRRIEVSDVKVSNSERVRRRHLPHPGRRRTGN